MCFRSKIYPANPKIPIMLFNMENRVAQDDIFAGFLDVAPWQRERRLKIYAEQGKESY